TLVWAAARVPAPAAAPDRAGDRAIVRRTLRLGLPIGLQLGAEVGAFALAGLLAGRLGVLPAAAHQVALLLSSVPFHIALGIGSAAAVRVGHAVGAGDPDAPRRAGAAALALT